MSRPTVPGPVLPLLLLCAATLACADAGSRAVGTRELRAALADSILEWTAQREAFSQPKHELFGFDPLVAMAAYRHDVIAADDPVELYYALARMSHARRDRHLELALVPGGLELPENAGLPGWLGIDPPAPRRAPVRVFPDQSADGPAYFIADVADDPAMAEGPAPGERLVAVNGRPVAEYETMVAPYLRHSTPANLRWRIGMGMPVRTAELPPSFYGATLELTTEAADGTQHEYSLPYRAAGALAWRDLSEPAYPGFSTAMETPTFDLLVPDDDRPLLVLLWHGFERTLVRDVDALMEMATERSWLDRAIIFDATRSGGGSLGAYAVQRLQPRPFRTTFGTLRLSDVIEPFIADKQAEVSAGGAMDSGGPEGLDDGTWLLDWLVNDVADALARGDSVTAAVPFKLAHAPKDSDGALQPAPVHFRGPLAVFCTPRRGSHLDQFMAIVVDNGLGRVIGLPAGGYSNTWEWEEVLTFPGTDQPVVGFMWSIGHTVRPNGEVLEGNPAEPHEWIAPTPENVGHYYEILYDRALAYFASVGHPAGVR